MDARIRIILYTQTSQYQNLFSNPLRCPDTNRIRVDVRIRYVWTQIFLYPHKKIADTKISGYVWTGPKEKELVFIVRVFRIGGSISSTTYQGLASRDPQ